jgi:glycosyltransferase involved in cell wall biosynthesis
MNKNAKIVMVAMFKNEAKVLRNMLNSVTKYIDFWVIQNNGSTDGSDQIVREWAEETGIPGVLYDVEEGWVGFGWNRDHLIRKCQSIDHGCDWILKMDCDETLEVDNDFD